MPRKARRTFDPLTEAVIRHIGGAREEALGDLEGVRSRGADGAGVSGFIYTNDTADFYDRQNAKIWQALGDDAAEEGITIMQLIAGFKVKPVDDTSFKNLLAWYALERAARVVDE